MTFNFTLDAFPDYVKFDKTHKVLAAIQIIEDGELDEIAGTREPCKMGEDSNVNTPNVSAYSSNIKAYFTGDDNDTIVVTGTSNGDEYDNEIFGTEAKGAQITINLPVYKTGGTYTVIQENPGLSKYYPDDSFIKDNTKTKSYTIGAEENLEYDLLVTDQGGPITVELKNEAGTSMAKYTIATAVVFA